MGGDGPTSAGSAVTLQPDPEEQDGGRRFCRTAEAFSAGAPLATLAARLNAVI
ncbi:hypothetical protein Q760_04015 [Cellulomonas cellasea DSM 20118]|uniref:Uncharacterized protein n=1 Tax=Cellulomonas cellasea DSM 20118 TaxID=1408250 RepID=A0A0A0BBD3_9CELL|nr:hypothetical protein Q760_04015 [Cellulomonas cellasea DSM 20118]